MQSYFLFALCSLPALAGAVTLTLASVADHTVRHHPALAVARWRIEEARGRLLGAGRLTNPKLNAEHGANANGREGGAEVSFQMNFPITNRLALERELSAADVALAVEEVREQERQLAAQAESAAVLVLALRAQMEIRSRQGELSRQFADALRQRAKAGEGSPLDAGQAETEVAQNELELRQLRAEEAAALNQLRQALGLGPRQPLVLSGRIDPPAPTTGPPSHEAMLTRRPEYRRAEIERRAAEVARDLARANRYQDITLEPFVWTGREEDQPLGVEREFLGGIRFSIPLPLWNQNQGQVAEAQARAERMTAAKAALGVRISSEVAAAATDMRQQSEIYHEARGKLLPLAEQQVRRQKEAYDAGQGDFIALLRAQEQRLRLEMMSIAALREWSLARVRWRAAQGLMPSPSASPK